MPVNGLLETDLYDARFSMEDVARIRRIWQPIVRFLQRYVDPAGTTVDIGAGACHFINSVVSAKRIAIDINEKSLRLHADPGVRTVVFSGGSLADVTGERSVSTVFASNVFEHFQTREDVARTLAQGYELLEPGGRFIVLQPNFRYCMKRYYDFFDHRLAFTHEAMIEGLVTAGFAIERAIPQFLPYTTKTALPQHPALVELYLRIPPAWKILGGQMLLVGRKPPFALRPSTSSG